MHSAYALASPSARSAEAGTWARSSFSLLVPAARMPIAGSASKRTPSVDASTMKSAGPEPWRSAAITNSSASAARGTSDFTPSST